MNTLSANKMFGVLLTLLPLGGIVVGCDLPSSQCTHPWDGAPGSCSLPDAGLGSLGGPCNFHFGTPAVCSLGTTCVDDVCIACGANNNVCCDVGPFSYNTLECDKGTCDLASAKCVQSQNGQPQNGQCVGSMSYYKVWLKDAWSCATVSIEVCAESEADAQQSVGEYETANGFIGDCGLYGTPTSMTVCATSTTLGTWPVDVTVCAGASTSTDITSCESKQCGNCTFSFPDSNGSCGPASPKRAPRAGGL